jgi:hypothetical protein
LKIYKEISLKEGLLLSNPSVAGLLYRNSIVGGYNIVVDLVEKLCCKNAVVGNTKVTLKRLKIHNSSTDNLKKRYCNKILLFTGIMTGRR